MMTDLEYKNEFARLEYEQERKAFMSKLEYEKYLQSKIQGVEVKPTPAKRIWTEDEIKNLVQVNDKVLYGALRKLYACQTAEEQNDKETHEQNGKGFNGVDAPILSSFCEFLNKTGFLTPKQKVLARKKLVKYNKQLTLLANA